MAAQVTPYESGVVDMAYACVYYADFMKRAAFDGAQAFVDRAQVLSNDVQKEGGWSLILGPIYKARLISLAVDMTAVLGFNPILEPLPNGGGTVGTAAQNAQLGGDVAGNVEALTGDALQSAKEAAQGLSGAASKVWLWAKQSAFYVALAVAALVVLFVVIRAWRKK